MSLIHRLPPAAADCTLPVSSHNAVETPTGFNFTFTLNNDIPAGTQLLRCAFSTHPRQLGASGSPDSLSWTASTSWDNFLNDVNANVGCSSDTCVYAQTIIREYTEAEISSPHVAEFEVYRGSATTLPVALLCAFLSTTSSCPVTLDNFPGPYITQRECLCLPACFRQALWPA